MTKLQTILGEDIPITTRGIVYFGTLTPNKFIVRQTVMFDNRTDAFQCYANTPNPESQLITGNTFDELIANLHILHEQMNTQEWVNYMWVMI